MVQLFQKVMERLVEYHHLFYLNVELLTLENLNLYRFGAGYMDTTDTMGSTWQSLSNKLSSRRVLSYLLKTFT